MQESGLPDEETVQCLATEFCIVGNLNLGNKAGCPMGNLIKKLSSSPGQNPILFLAKKLCGVTVLYKFYTEHSYM